MAVAHGALYLFLVLYVCGVGCSADYLTEGGILPKLRGTRTTPTVPVDKQIPANPNVSDHENFYNLDLYSHYTTVNLRRPFDVPPHFDGRDDDGLPEDGARHEGEDDIFTAFSKDKKDTVNKSGHNTDDSSLPSTEIMSNVSSLLSYGTVQSVSSVDSAKTPSGPGFEAGHDTGQESKNTAPSLNSDHNRTSEGAVAPTTLLPFGGEGASVAGFRDVLKNYTHSRDSEADTDFLLPEEPMEPLCVVTPLPLRPGVPPQYAASDSMLPSSTAPPGDDTRDFEKEVLGLAGDNGHEQYMVTCNASVTLNNLSAVADNTHKRRTIGL